MMYAGFGKRFAAWFLDFLILIIPTILLSLAVPLSSVFIGFLYYTVFLSSSLKGTPGKVIMGLEVLTLTGERISYKTSIFRYLMSFVSAFLCGFGYLMNLFTAKRQTLHDLVTETVVVVRTPLENPDWINSWVAEFKRIVSSVVQSGPAAATVGVSHSPSAGPQSTPDGFDPLAKLEKLHRLYKEGAITESEYQKQKEQLLKV